jgi:hypothetical protein
MIRLRFASVSLSDTTAKESRVKLSLHGFTFSMASDLVWINDLGMFAKAPEGVNTTSYSILCHSTDLPFRFDLCLGVRNCGAK